MSTINTYDSSRPECGGEKQRFIDLALKNAELADVLKRLPDLGVKDCWVVSGGLVQSTWNALFNKAPNFGILDYDLIYFDSDISWDSEDRVIQRGKMLFGDISKPVEIRNQARVHLWYEKKYGRHVPPLRSSCQSLWRYPSRTTAVAINIDNNSLVKLYAPFGVNHALNLKIQPNRRSRQPAAYIEKSQRWQTTWPELEVIQW